MSKQLPFTEDGFEISEFGYPEKPGVYAVIVKSRTTGLIAPDIAVYIGSSTNISKRVLNINHPYRTTYDTHSGDNLVYVAYRLMHKSQLAEEEKRLISKYSPALNVQHKRTEI